MNVGVAAHITAASVGGPRYDAFCGKEYRSSAQNGIWLCQTCAKLIDSDPSQFSKEILLDWKLVAEQFAFSELHQNYFPTILADDHSIRFAVDGWEMWKNRGNDPSDTVIFIDGWKKGNVLYSCKIRLRNDLPHDELLHSPLIEFHHGPDVIYSDDYPFNVQDIELPSKRWVTLDVDYGLHDIEIFKQADSVWFSVKTVGDNETHRWQVAKIDHTAVEFM
ncbi:hypothetical protein F1728_15145 [Gimesia benthica]|uniref:HNH endonuclease n=1 Tax=Gimesia benthica TaxID=2608982 RepID=A0A6I6AEX3_9PLAN|nr:hypothetical protein [Gimesia benthica]QGQ23935.1 hypothetical protein F1728_15145 [Gimesia benthica]